ncbi:RING finger protein 214 isoform 2-T5 [Rhinophrynus dorsalis]
MEGADMSVVDTESRDAVCMLDILNEGAAHSSHMERVDAIPSPLLERGDSVHNLGRTTCSGQETCHFGTHAQSIAVQTEYRRQDAESLTDRDTEQVLKELVNLREKLKNSYQVVLDRQTQAERQLQVQIKQLRMQRDEEMQRHLDTLRSIQDVTQRREESRKRMEKEKKEQSQKEHDLSTDLEKLQNKSQRLQQEQEELESKIAKLLADQAKEKEVWDAELAALKKMEDELAQSVLEETERAARSEVLLLQSRRDFLLVSLEDAESEAEVTLSCLRVANSTPEWIQLQKRWEGRLAGIQKMKASLWDQFETQIQEVKSGTKLSNLPSILAPNLPPPPSDTNLMLQKIALAPLQGPNPAMPVPMPIQSKDCFPLQPQIPASLPAKPSHYPPHISGSFTGTSPAVPRPPTAPHVSGTCDPPAPAGVDKLGKILEKLQARFPQCNKPQLTGIMQQIKMTRGTLAGLTVEELCQLVASRLMDAPDSGARVTIAPGNTRPQYHTTQGASTFLPLHQGAYTGRPQQHSAPFKLCLMCQQLVHPPDLQPMSCAHAMHRECIRFWAQTNQKDSCPFCPSHR